jgi:hypothetical protein
LKNSCQNREIINFPIEGNTAACGANCVQMEGEGRPSCNTSCKNVWHYSNNSIGVCEIISDCNKRGIVNWEGKPCGEGCVKRVMAEGLSTEVCSDKCWNEAHFKSNELGICTLIEKCSSRNVNINSQYVCGDWTCYEQEGTTSCDDSCINTHHYHPNNKGICIEKICTERQILINEKITRVCGSGNCYKSEKHENKNENNEVEDKNEDEKKIDEEFCVESCDNPRFNYLYFREFFYICMLVMLKFNLFFYFFFFFGIVDIIIQIIWEFVS